MFRVFNDKGFTVGFANGYEVSVMFGEGNYSSARNVRAKPGDRQRGSATAEICVFVTGSNRFLDNDTLKVDAPAMSSDGFTFGWSSAEVFAAICASVAALPAGLPGRSE